MNRYPRVVLTTGGTGGHIFPALAVAEQLREFEPEIELLFIGSQHGPEKGLAAEAGLTFIGLPVHGVLGRGIRAIGALAGIARSIVRARRILAKFEPDVVAGFGAYASMPALVAAKSCKIPIAVHEQNAIPGLSNKLMGRLAGKIFLSLPDKANCFDPKKTLLTGNPVRKSIATLRGDASQPKERPRLLVMGGSQGARAINSAVLSSLPLLDGVFIHHQTGPADLERVRAGYAAHGFGPEQAKVVPFISDMADAYRQADLALCRSGATTVAELALAGKPAIFIPFPHATHDHQTANALAMVEAGAARMIQEQEIPTKDLAGIVLSLLHDHAALDAMSAAAVRCANPRAAQDVARGILQLAMRT